MRMDRASPSPKNISSTLIAVAATIVHHLVTFAAGESAPVGQPSPTQVPSSQSTLDIHSVRVPRSLRAVTQCKAILVHASRRLQKRIGGSAHHFRHRGDYNCIW